MKQFSDMKWMCVINYQYHKSREFIEHGFMDIHSWHKKNQWHLPLSNEFIVFGPNIRHHCLNHLTWCDLLSIEVPQWVLSKWRCTWMKTCSNVLFLRPISLIFINFYWVLPRLWPILRFFWRVLWVIFWVYFPNIILFICIYNPESFNYLF